MRGKSRAQIARTQISGFYLRSQSIKKFVLPHSLRQKTPNHRAFIGNFGVIVIVERRNRVQRRVSLDDCGVSGSLPHSFNIRDVFSILIFQKLGRNKPRQAFADDAERIALNLRRISNPNFRNRFGNVHSRQRIDFLPRENTVVNKNSSAAGKARASLNGDNLNGRIRSVSQVFRRKIFCFRCEQRQFVRAFPSVRVRAFRQKHSDVIYINGVPIAG